MSILAMKQALESLKVLLRDYGAVHDAGDLEMQPAFHQAHIAIEKLRQAIEQAEKQEPVAWMYEWGGNKHLTFVDQRFIEKAHPHFNKSTPLYTAPVHASDISAKRVDETEKDRHEWVGLTKKDGEMLVAKARKVPTEIPCPDYNERLLALVDNFLKEKNT
jgi:hypothetical protein